MKKIIRTVILSGGVTAAAAPPVPPSSGNMRYMILTGLGGDSWTGGGIEEFILSGLSVNPAAPLMAPMTAAPIPVVSLFGWKIPAYDSNEGKWIWDNLIAPIAELWS